MKHFDKLLICSGGQLSRYKMNKIVRGNSIRSETLNTQDKSVSKSEKMSKQQLTEELYKQIIR